MFTTRLLVISACLMIGFGVVAAQDKDRKLDPEIADAILKDAPLTIVFRQFNHIDSFDGVPYVWCWSINSAGQGELTVAISAKLRTFTKEKTTQQKIEFSASQMAAIRKVLREERFFHFKEEYGPVVIHSGWSTLTVIAGDKIKQVHFCSSWCWPSELERENMAEEKSAIRVWLKVCEVVDPDGKVFPERKSVAKALAAVKK